MSSLACALRRPHVHRAAYDAEKRQALAILGDLKWESRFRSEVNEVLDLFHHREVSQEEWMYSAMSLFWQAMELRGAS